MNAVKVETTVQTDGELHLKGLPCRQGDKVEAIVLVLEPARSSASGGAQAQAMALEEFLTLARASPFCSTGPYPDRDQLHERS